MITEWVDATALSHSLFSFEIRYNTRQYALEEWRNTTKLIMKYPDFTLFNLTITKVEWVSSNHLKFYTDNPISDLDLNTIPARLLQQQEEGCSYSSDVQSYSSSRSRLLTTMPSGYMTYLDMKQ